MNTNINANHVENDSEINNKFIDIKNYEGLYKINRNGEIYSVKRNKILKQSISHYGYRVVELSKEGKGKMKFVHRLIAEAFIPNPNHYLQINHINEIKTDNRIENLEWCTSKHNMNHGTRTKRVTQKLYIYRRYKILQVTKNEFTGKKQLVIYCDAMATKRYGYKPKEVINNCDLYGGTYKNSRWYYLDDYEGKIDSAVYRYSRLMEISMEAHLKKLSKIKRQKTEFNDFLNHEFKNSNWIS